MKMSIFQWKMIKFWLKLWIFDVCIFGFLSLNTWNEQEKEKDELNRPDLLFRVGPCWASTLGKVLRIVPTAFVLPSRKTIRVPSRRYSGRRMKRKRTVSRSPVRKICLPIRMMLAVWRIEPTWTKKTVCFWEWNKFFRKIIVIYWKLELFWHF